MTSSLFAVNQGLGIPKETHFYIFLFLFLSILVFSAVLFISVLFSSKTWHLHVSVKLR